MKKNHLLLFLLLLCATTKAQMHGYNTNFDFSQRDFCDTIPLDVENDQLYINVTMNDERHRFNLDTGSSQGMVYERAHIGNWKELGKVISRDANNYLDTVKVIQLPSFSMGPLTVSHYVASVIPHPMAHYKYDAIIGFDFFNKGLCAKIDARRKIMIITDRRHAFDSEIGYTVKYKLKWFVPYLLVSPFIRHVDEALFDMGSRPLYTMNKQNFDEHAYMSKNVGSQVTGIAKGHLAIGNYGTEQMDEVAFLNLDRLKWGDFSFCRVRAITTQGSSRIGAQLLKYGSVIINPYQKSITFQPFDSPDSVVVNNKIPDVAFVPVDGRATVGLIRQESKAYKAGMRQGDTIIAIDGKPIYSFEDFTRFPFVESRQNTFLLRDEKGRMKKISIER